MNHLNCILNQIIGDGRRTVVVDFAGQMFLDVEIASEVKMGAKIRFFWLGE